MAFGGLHGKLREVVEKANSTFGNIKNPEGRTDHIWLSEFLSVHFSLIKLLTPELVQLKETWTVLSVNAN